MLEFVAKKADKNSPFVTAEPNMIRFVVDEHAMAYKKVITGPEQSERDVYAVWSEVHEEDKASDWRVLYIDAFSVNLAVKKFDSLRLKKAIVKQPSEPAKPSKTMESLKNAGSSWLG
jgi:hypothetical protein